jgi:serine/threonine-protein kinase
MKPDRIGRYEILRTLGRGSAAVVFLARDPLIQRVVALKALRIDPRAVDVEERKARFLREVRVVGHLQHPGIVMVYDVGEDPALDMLYIAMEHVDGGSLEGVIGERGGEIDVGEAAGLVAPAAEALDHAHFQGVVHRDVKPANLLVDGRGTVKVTDFGVAKRDLFDLTFGGKPVGTPQYMSPEQIKGETVDGRSDLFSLGVVLFELLTGTKPFEGATVVEVCERIVSEPAPDPCDLSPAVPELLGEIVQLCLAKDPEDRFGTCGDLAHALRRLATPHEPR